MHRTRIAFTGLAVLTTALAGACVVEGELTSEEQGLADHAPIQTFDDELVAFDDPTVSELNGAQEFPAELRIVRPGVACGDVLPLDYDDDPQLDGAQLAVAPKVHGVGMYAWVRVVAEGRDTWYNADATVFAQLTPGMNRFSIVASTGQWAGESAPCFVEVHQ